MSKFNHLIISAILFLLGSTVQAQLISVKSQISSDSMMIGDHVLYNLRVEVADHVNFLLPNIQDTLSSNLEILFPVSSDTVLNDGRRVVDLSYVITCFEPGMQLVPSQEVLYTTGEISDTAVSMPLMIQVFEPVVDTAQQIKPIKPPINTPLTFREVVPWIAAGIGGLMLFTFLFLVIRRYRLRKRNPEIFSMKPQEPAHVIAFRELDKLKKEKIWEKGQVKSYYTQLTNITRQYIERQYGIPAMERTTDEILSAFRKASAEDNLLDEMLRELLVLADLVKFAKEDPLPVFNQTNLNNAYIFVQKTYPRFFNEEIDHKIGEDTGDE